jgi:hypothetical protein
MSTTEHYGKTTTASLPARVGSTTAGIVPYKGTCRCRSGPWPMTQSTTAKRQNLPGC